MYRKITSFLLFALILMLITGCIGRLDVGATRTDSETIRLGDADSANVDIKMGVGRINLSGGASELLEADFTYNVDEWEPEVSYQISGGEGRLNIRQPDSEVGFDNIPDDEIEYEWDLHFNNEVPMDLEVDLGVGDSELMLSGLTLTYLDVEVGVGEVNLDLSGDWDQSFDVNIKGGVGKTTVYLPQDVGVRVDTRTGLGSVDVHGLIRNGNIYTNEAYEGADVVLDIEIRGGLGEIELHMGD